MATELEIDVARIAHDVGVSTPSVEKAVSLLDDGNTVPFITRYRRDVTGGLDEQQIEAIRAAVVKGRQLAQRKQTILRSIESQGRLTDELRQQIEQAPTLQRLDDLYLPYRPKKQTLANKARESGLAPLAAEIADGSCQDIDVRAADFVNEDKAVASIADALLGAGHILSEQFSENALVRQKARKSYRRTGRLVSVKIEEDEKKNKQYRDYFAYEESVASVPHHRVLAINRGERAKVLRVRIQADEAALTGIATELLVPADHPHRDYVVGCATDMLRRLLIPSLERETRRELTEQAEEHAVEVFARNMRQLLLQPTLPNKRILAIDPGFKKGCKLAALDQFGEVLELGLIHVLDDEQKSQARDELARLADKHDLNVVAIGNGTACRQVEELVAEVVQRSGSERELQYIIVNEAGASVYSTSALGREELPECDPLQRSAVSIGRRLIDPLSELVKIDPASIGVGLYQHDAKANHLREKLQEVVRSCVSFVGVDVNSASVSLLQYVSGLNQLVARRIYEFRKQHGAFRNRLQLHEVPGLGQATFVQAAGFLKIDGGDDPLDSTWIHPESYESASQLLQQFDIAAADVVDRSACQQISQRASEVDRQQLAAKLDVGELLLADMIDALARPGRDPRQDLPPPIFRRGILKIDDLAVGMQLQGTVLNVVDFGAFVDVGLPDSGLVHISQLDSRFVRDPHQVVAVGDRVKVWVCELDPTRRRVALTMVEPGSEPARDEKRGRKPQREKPASSSSADRGQSAASGRAASRRRSKSRTAGKNRGKRGADTQRARGRAYETKSAQELTPITDEMMEGTEAMRTFGDLLQFHQRKEEGAGGDPPADS